MSQPSWAAWIEINSDCVSSFLPVTSQPSWAAWIEIMFFNRIYNAASSQPSWAAWIEMMSITDAEAIRAVAALLGCVD